DGHVTGVQTCALPIYKKERRPCEPPPLLRSGDLQVVVLQRERPDALAGGPEVGVEHGGCRHQNRRLADATPRGVAARHDDRFHLDRKSVVLGKWVMSI